MPTSGPRTLGRVSSPCVSAPHHEHLRTVASRLRSEANRGPATTRALAVPDTGPPHPYGRWWWTWAVGLGALDSPAGPSVALCLL